MMTPIKDEELHLLRNKTETSRSLSDKQFDQSMDYAKILRREIQAEGAFKDKLDGMAREFAIGQKFGAYTAANIIRDQYELRYNETPKDHMQRLLKNEEKLGEFEKTVAYDQSIACRDKMVRQSEPQFYRAYDSQANDLAKSLNITEKKAKSLMVKAYKEKHTDNYFKDFGKAEEIRLRTERGLPILSQTMKQSASPSVS